MLQIPEGDEGGPVAALATSPLVYTYTCAPHHAQNKKKHPVLTMKQQIRGLIAFNVEHSSSGATLRELRLRSTFSGRDLRFVTAGARL